MNYFKYPRRRPRRLMLCVHEEGRAAVVGRRPARRWSATSPPCTATDCGPPCRGTTRSMMGLLDPPGFRRNRHGQIWLHLAGCRPHAAGDAAGAAGGAARRARARGAPEDPLATLVGIDPTAVRPADPALARLFPDAYEDRAGGRRVPPVHPARPPSAEAAPRIATAQATPGARNADPARAGGAAGVAGRSQRPPADTGHPAGGHRGQPDDLLDSRADDPRHDRCTWSTTGSPTTRISWSRPFSRHPPG